MVHYEIQKLPSGYINLTEKLTPLGYMYMYLHVA